jgi:hypothetical protein
MTIKNNSIKTSILMKKNIFRVALASCIVLGVSSCSSTDEPGKQDNPVYITINSLIGGNNASRTTTQQDGSEVFSEGDVISVYAWTGSATTIPETLVVNNSLNTLTSSTWVPTPQMLWQNSTAVHYFLGVYPKREITNFTADNFTLSTTDLASNDLLIAVNTTGLTATNNPVTLNFNHAMAKLIVNLTYRNQWSSIPTVTSVVAKATTSATVNYLAAAPFTASSTLSNIALSTVTANKQYSDVMIPQSSFKEVVITIDGKDYTYTKSDAIKLESGKITTLNLIVGRDNITAESVTINDWVTGDIIDGGEAL